MELYQFLSVLYFIRLVGACKISYVMFTVLMLRHLNKKFLSDDKKYKLIDKFSNKTNARYNKIKMNFNNYLEKNKDKYLCYSIKMTCNSYLLFNNYYKLISNELFCMFADLFSDIASFYVDRRADKVLENISKVDTKLVNNILNSIVDKVDSVSETKQTSLKLINLLKEKNNIRNNLEEMDDEEVIELKKGIDVLKGVKIYEDLTSVRI